MNAGLVARAGNQPRAMHGGPAEGEAQRRGVGGVEARPRDGPGAAHMGEGGGGRGGRTAVGLLHGRNGRFAPYAAARATGRACGRAKQQNAGNSPARPTSPFSPQSARGEPRHVGCSALATMRDE